MGEEEGERSEAVERPNEGMQAKNSCTRWKSNLLREIGGDDDQQRKGET